MFTDGGSRLAEFWEETWPGPAAMEAGQAGSR